jgi:hypothetical protein
MSSPPTSILHPLSGLAGLNPDDSIVYTSPRRVAKAAAVKTSSNQMLHGSQGKSGRSQKYQNSAQHLVKILAGKYPNIGRKISSVL